MGIFRGNGGTGDSNTDATVTAVTQQAVIATTKASDAADSAVDASGFATTASNSATQANTSAFNAATSETNAAASFDSFDDRYLGAKSSEPSTDNDGDALITGALYFNTTTNDMKVWSGSAWLDAYASTSGTLAAANNLSDLDNVATARTNLGLGTAATTASTDYATSAQGTTADAALPKAGGAMTGAITTNSTFDGRDVANDGSKLDGIEAGATADQTAAEIKTAYESNADTNAFTDANNTKLGGIEASADVTDTANVTAAGAVMDSEVDANIKTLVLPASTTISAYGKTLVDDADSAAARTTLGLGTAATTAATDYLASTGGTVTGDVDFISTDAGSSAGPEFTLFRNSSSPADGDYLGQVKFDGKSDTGVTRLFAKITAKTSDVTNGTEDGLIETAVKVNGSNVIVSRQTGAALKLINGCAIEVDGTVTATGGTSTNWNTAYGWGDHASAGYLTSSSTLNASNMTTGTLDGGTY